MSLDSLKQTAAELMKIKGNTIQARLLVLKKYIEAKYGQEGVKKLQEKMKEIGYPLSFKHINPLAPYRESLSILSMLVAKEIFGWKDLFDLGYNTPVFSLGAKVFIKLLPLRLFIKRVPKIWRKFFDVGNLEVAEFNPKEKYFLVRLKNYKFHPEMCRYYTGYFLRIVSYLIKGKNMRVEETKCIHRSDPYHEFKISWE